MKHKKSTACMKITIAPKKDSFQKPDAIIIASLHAIEKDNTMQGEREKNEQHLVDVERT